MFGIPDDVVTVSGHHCRVHWPAAVRGFPAVHDRSRLVGKYLLLLRPADLPIF